MTLHTHSTPSTQCLTPSACQRKNKRKYIARTNRQESNDTPHKPSSVCKPPTTSAVPLPGLRQASEGTGDRPQDSTPNNRSCTFALTKEPGLNFRGLHLAPSARASIQRKIAQRQEEPTHDHRQRHKLKDKAPGAATLLGLFCFGRSSELSSDPILQENLNRGIM